MSDERELWVVDSSTEDETPPMKQEVKRLIVDTMKGGDNVLVFGDRSTITTRRDHFDRELNARYEPARMVIINPWRDYLRDIGTKGVRLIIADGIMPRNVFYKIVLPLGLNAAVKFVIIKRDEHDRLVDRLIELNDVAESPLFTKRVFSK